MAKIKETRAAYSAEPITVVTRRGTTEIPRVLRERYRITARSRLRWVDTGKGWLVTPLPSSSSARVGVLQDANPMPTYKSAKQNKREFLAWLDQWLQEPDDWTPQQWDEFERELRTRRVKFRDVEI
jgi:bifunctional DNA-binding transcriptional regulator/antitoxin component of YhaV-PrlF toxin-antitoxin module